METAKPTLSQAEEFADGVHAKWPGKMLAYNLSPSFNWDAAGMTDEQIERFTCDLGRRGFVWQFITLAGFHTNGLAIHNFVNGYAEKGKAAARTRHHRPLPTHHSPLTTHTTHTTPLLPAAAGESTGPPPHTTSSYETTSQSRSAHTMSASHYMLAAATSPSTHDT